MSWRYARNELENTWKVYPDSPIGSNSWPRETKCDSSTIPNPPPRRVSSRHSAHSEIRKYASSQEDRISETLSNILDRFSQRKWNTPNLSERLGRYSEKSANNKEFLTTTAKVWMRQFVSRQKQQNPEISFSSLPDVRASGCSVIISIERRSFEKRWKSLTFCKKKL